MNIVYLIEWDLSGYSGVERKYLAQIESWKKNGCNVTGIVVGKNLAKDKIKTDSIDFWCLPSNALLEKILVNQLIKQLYLICIYFKYSFKKVDILYYRMSTLSFVFLYPLRFRMALELNSIDSEAKSGIKKIIRPIGDWYRDVLLKRSYISFFVTNELKEYYEAKFGKKIQHSYVIGNGYYSSYFTPDIMSAYFERKKNKKSKRVTFLFVGTADDVHYWFGHDKILKMVSQMPECNFIIVGNVKGADTSIYPNLKVLNKMETNDMLTVYSEADIGLAALALHRKSMNEGSALKVAEYVYFGLPVVTGHIDNNVAGSEYNLQLENEEDSINEESLIRIKQFAETYGNVILPTSERQRVDLMVKESERVDLIKNRLYNLS